MPRPPRTPARLSFAGRRPAHSHASLRRPSGPAPTPLARARRRAGVRPCSYVLCLLSRGIVLCLLLLTVSTYLSAVVPSKLVRVSSRLQQRLRPADSVLRSCGTSAHAIARLQPAADCSALSPTGLALHSARTVLHSLCRSSTNCLCEPNRTRSCGIPERARGRKRLKAR